MSKRVGMLVAVSLFAWAALGYSAWRVMQDDTAIVYSTVAVLLCLVPTTATMLWAGWAYRQSPEQQLWMVLGGTSVRMGLVLGVGLALYALVPYFNQQSFWVWLLVFYLLTLAVEMVLVVKTQPATKEPQQAAAPTSLPRNS